MKDLLKKVSVYGAMFVASAAGMSLAAENGNDLLSLNTPVATEVSTAAPEGSQAPAAPAGQTTATPLFLDDAPAPAAPAVKKISGSLSVTVPTKYISRGLILNNDRGFIAQPAAEIDFAAYASDTGFIRKVTPYVGIWNDLTSHRNYAGQPHHLSNWYEFDWDAGVSIDLPQGFNFNVQYIEFTSPSNAFGTSKNIIPVISYDDSPLWAKRYPGFAFALKPYVAGLIETNGKAGSGRHLGQYLEPGIDPTYTFMPKASYPITVDVPIKVGLGFDNFYGGRNAGSNKTFGYFSIGINGSVPLPFMDKAVGGTWKVTAGAAYYYYGDGTHYFNSSTVGQSDRSDVIGSVGLQVNF